LQRRVRGLRGKVVVPKPAWFGGYHGWERWRWTL